MVSWSLFIKESCIDNKLIFFISQDHLLEIFLPYMLWQWPIFLTIGWIRRIFCLIIFSLFLQKNNKIGQVYKGSLTTELDLCFLVAALSVRRPLPPKTFSIVFCYSRWWSCFAPSYWGRRGSLVTATHLRTPPYHNRLERSTFLRWRGIQLR